MKTKILKVFFGSFPTLAERNQQTQSLKPNTSLLLSFCTYPISKLDILQKEKHAQPFAEIDTGASNHYLFLTKIYSYPIPSKKNIKTLNLIFYTLDILTKKNKKTNLDLHN